MANLKHQRITRLGTLLAGVAAAAGTIALTTANSSPAAASPPPVQRYCGDFYGCDYHYWGPGGNVRQGLAGCGQGMTVYDNIVISPYGTYLRVRQAVGPRRRRLDPVRRVQCEPALTLSAIVLMMA